MFYCRKCKKKSSSPICESCGTPFTSADEIVNCPNCNKMFFKPEFDFTCSKCGTMVSVKDDSGVQNQTSTMPNASQLPPNPYANMQGQNVNQTQQVPYNQQQFVPPNQMVQPNQNMQNQTGFVPPYAQNTQNMGGVPPYNQQQFVPPNQMAQPNPSMQQSPYEQQQYVQQNQMAQQDMYGQNNFAANMAQQNNSASNMASQDNYAQTQMSEEEQFKQTESIVNDYLNTNTDVDKQEETTTDDFASLFSASDLNASDEEETKEENVDFGSLRSESEHTEDDGKTYDENGYEVVQSSEGSSKGKKKKGKKNKESNEKPSQGGGCLKAFAWLEFLLLLACFAGIGYLGYLQYGDYITTGDPCLRAWHEYVEAQTIILGEDHAYKAELTEIEKSEDEKFGLYKIADDNTTFIIFSIEPGFKLSVFLDLSKAKVEEINTYTGESAVDDAKAYFADYVAIHS